MKMLHACVVVSLCALLLSNSNVLAESSINVISASNVAEISIENGDLLNMPSFRFTENRNDKKIGSALFTKTKATSRTMDSGAIETIWEGVIMDEGRVGFATLVRSIQGGFAGTLSTEEAAFSLTKMPGGTVEIQKSLWKDELKTGDPDDALEEDENQQMIQLASIKASNNAAVKATSFVRFDTSGSIETSLGEASTVTRPTNERTRMLRVGSERRSLQTRPVVDILILITNRAMCESSKQKYGCQATERNRAHLESKMPLLQSQSNKAIQDVGVAAEIQIVGAVHLDPSYDYTPGPEAAGVIRTDPNIKQWRDDYGADLVAMITGPGGSYGGWAYYNSFASTTSYTQLSYYTFTHELGHNFGCYHNRENTQQDHSWAHGLQVPGVLRTMMSYACSSGSCPRIPLFSSNGYSYDGTLIGDSSHDCAREIALNIPSMSKWRAPVSVPMTQTPTTNAPTSLPTTGSLASPTKAPTDKPTKVPTGNPRQSPTEPPMEKSETTVPSVALNPTAAPQTIETLSIPTLVATAVPTTTTRTGAPFVFTEVLPPVQSNKTTEDTNAPSSSIITITLEPFASPTSVPLVPSMTNAPFFSFNSTTSDTPVDFPTLSPTAVQSTTASTRPGSPTIAPDGDNNMKTVNAPSGPMTPSKNETIIAPKNANISDKDGDSVVGAAVGITVGVAAIVAIAAILMTVRRMRQKKNKINNHDEVEEAAAVAERGGGGMLASSTVQIPSVDAIPVNVSQVLPGSKDQTRHVSGTV